LLFIMSDFAINPPVHIGRPEAIVRSVEQAAEFVRNRRMGNLDGDTSGLLEKLHNVQSPEQAQDAGRAFRMRLEKRHLLLVPPDTA
jgi:hypothetical protein